MPTTRYIACCAAVLAAGLALPNPSAAQVPLGIRTASGLTVTPAYEGWYENADGTFSLSFGYYNRNFEEIVDIPVGPGNQHRAGRLRRRPAHALPPAPPLGRVHGRGPGGLRRPGRRVDDRLPGREVCDPGNAPPRLADRRARRARRGPATRHRCSPSRRAGRRGPVRAGSGATRSRPWRGRPSPLPYGPATMAAAPSRGTRRGRRSP